MQALADVRKLNIAVVSGVEIERAAHVRNSTVFDFAIHLNVTGDLLDGDGAVANMERGTPFYVVSSEVAAVCAEIDVAIMLRDAEVAAPRGQRKRNLLWQLQVKIEAGLLEITAGEVKQPNIALLDELRTRGFIQTVGALL